MGYVFARTFRKGNERSNAAEMGQAQKNDIRVKRQLENLMKGLMYMENRFIRADDVAQELNVSKPYAYKLIRKLNEELKAQGFITIAGRVNRQYFYERLYGAGKESK